MELLNDTIELEKQPSFFNFIFKTKLTARVQNRVKQGTIPITVEQLISVLRNTYRIKKSTNALLNELTRIVQTDSIRKFSDRIETLVTELNELQIGELGESSRNSIIRANEMIAFNSFKNGLKDREISRTIEASRIRSFTEAIEIAEETSSDMRQNRVMFQTSQRRANGNNWTNRNSNIQFQNKCKNCGGNHGSRCPAEGKKCNLCGKMNHFASVCYNRNRNMNNGSRDNNSGYNNSYGGNRGNYHNRGNNRNRGSYSNTNSNRNSNYGNNGNRKLRHIQNQGNS